MRRHYTSITMAKKKNKDHDDTFKAGKLLENITILLVGMQNGTDSQKPF